MGRHADRLDMGCALVAKFCLLSQVTLRLLGSGGSHLVLTAYNRANLQTHFRYAKDGISSLPGYRILPPHGEIRYVAQTAIS